MLWESKVHGGRSCNRVIESKRVSIAIVTQGAVIENKKNVPVSKLCVV